jgi:hypothetical protein
VIVVFFELFANHLAILVILFTGFAIAGLPIVLVAYVITYLLLRKWKSIAMSAKNAVLGFFVALTLLVGVHVLLYFAMERGISGGKNSMYDPLAALLFLSLIYVVVPPLMAVVPMGGSAIAIWMLSGDGGETKIRVALKVLGFTLGALALAAVLAAAFPKSGERDTMASSISSWKYQNMTPEQQTAYRRANEKKAEEEWRQEVREFAKHPGKPNSAYEHCRRIVASSLNKQESDIVPGQWKQFFRDDGRVKTRILLRTDRPPPQGPTRWFDCVAKRDHINGGQWATLSNRALNDPDEPDDPELDWTVRRKNPAEASANAARAFDPVKDYEEKRAKVAALRPGGEPTVQVPSAAAPRQPMSSEQLAIGYKACAGMVAKRLGPDAGLPSAPEEGRHTELDDGSVRFRIAPLPGSRSGADASFDCVAKPATASLWIVMSVNEAGKP